MKTSKILNRRYLWAVLVTGLSGLLLFWVYPKKPAYQIATPERINLTEQATAVGTIIPKHVVSVKSQIAGTVAHLYHQGGDFVQKGETLLDLKPNPTPHQLAEAIELVDRDKASLESGEKQLNSLSRLQKQGVVGRNYGDLVRAQERVKQDQATLAYDEQNLNLLQKGQALIDHQIVKNSVSSPISGRILQRNVDVGDTVFSSSDMQPATTLFTIANMHDMIFHGTVDQADADHLKVGMPATLLIGSLPQHPIQGRITALSLQSDEQNQKYVPNNGSWATGNNNTPFNVGFDIEIGDLQLPTSITLKSGFSATATIDITQHIHILAIDESLIHYQGDNPYVTLLDAHKKPQEQPITLGISDGIKVEVTQGVQLDDHLIIPSPNTA